MAGVSSAALAWNSRSGAADSWPAIPPEAWQEPARPDSGGRDAIILLRDAVLVDKEGSYESTLFERVKVFTDRGRDIGKVDVDLRKGRDRIVSLRARSVRKDGTVTELDPARIITSTVIRFHGIELARTSFLIPGIEPGCIAEYEIVRKGEYRNDWFDVWYFQSEYYTCCSSMEWRPSNWAHSNGLRPAWRLQRIAAPQVAQNCEPDCDSPRLVRLTATAIPGYRDEPMAPPPLDRSGRVVTFYVPERGEQILYWSLLKQLFDEAQNDVGDNLGDLAAIVDGVHAHNADPDGALAEMQRWFQTHIRCISEPSWQEARDGHPDGSTVKHDTSVNGLLQRGWGSDYFINVAFAAAARRLGVDACVALAGDRSEGGFDANVMGYPPANALTAVRLANGGWRFYDPASQFSPSGSIPWNLRGGYALMIGHSKDLLVTIDRDSGDPGRALWMMDLTLDGAGSLSGQVHASFRGESAREWKRWLWREDPGRWKELLQERLAPDHRPELEFANPDLLVHPDSSFTLQGKVRFPGLGSSAGGMMTLPLDRVVPWRLHDEFQAKARSGSVFFKFPRRESLVLDLHLPVGAGLEHLPEDAQFENEIGSWSTSWARTDDGIRFTRMLAIRTAETREYDQVRELFSSLDRAETALLLVHTP